MVVAAGLLTLALFFLGVHFYTHQHSQQASKLAQAHSFYPLAKGLIMASFG